MKALWKGYVSLGQLGIPVRLYPATRSSGLSFVQLHDKDGSPVERPLFCKAEHAEIPYKEVVRGVEVETGKYVTFTSQELEQGNAASSKAIEVQQFCKPSLIEPRYFDTPYYLVPGRGGERGYALIREGLDRTDTLAIVRFFFYGSSRLGAIETRGDVLLLHRLRYADELIARTEIHTPPLPRVSPAEVDLMQKVIERHSGPVHMRDYHNEHEERLRLLCERKAKGLPMPKPERQSPEATPEGDIEEMLMRIVNHSSPARLNERT